MVTIMGQPIPPHTVSKGNENVLEIDIEAAWNEMKPDRGYADFVVVRVYFPLEK